MGKRKVVVYEYQKAKGHTHNDIAELAARPFAQLRSSVWLAGAVSYGETTL